MVKLFINVPGNPPAAAELASGAYLIGTAPECQIQITAAGISKHHAQLIIAGAKVTLMDIGSEGGVLLSNGTQLYANEPYDLSAGGAFYLGKVEVVVENSELGETSPSPQPPPQPEKKVNNTHQQAEKFAEKVDNDDDKKPVPTMRISGISAEFRPLIQEIKKQAHGELLRRLNLKKMALSGVSDKELIKQATATVKEILEPLTKKLPTGLPIELLERELIQEATGLGPLEYLISRDDLTEIMVNGPDKIYVEKKGVIYRTDTAFADSNQVLAAIERIVAPLGRRIDESSPMVDARLADGSRVNAIIPPLSLVGPTITIRKFSKVPFQAHDLIRFGSISEDMIKFLAVCVAVRKNILISGGTGSGKTTLLNVLSNFLPNRERIITIEDAAELQLHQEHLVRLEARPPNIEGRGEIAIRDLVRNALRMRPDRIVIGECRGGEALDMLQAMNTGHDGSLTTIHANSPRDALSRLETLVLMSGFDLPLRAIREQIASAINIVVQITRERDGSRKVVNISEITKMEGEVITMQDLFVFKQTGWDSENKIMGYFEPTGNIPSFMEEVERAKLSLDIGMFKSKK